MSLAKEINEKLDRISFLKAGMEEMREEISVDSVLTNTETGDDMTLDDALACAQLAIDEVSAQLSEITNNGQNARNIFDNPYYVNDTIQDKVIVEQDRIIAEKIANKI